MIRIRCIELFMKMIIYKNKECEITCGLSQNVGFVFILILYTSSAPVAAFAAAVSCLVVIDRLYVCLS